MRRPLTLIALCGAVLWIHQVLGLAHVLRAAEVPTIVSVEVGIDGRFKSGYWTPLRIALRGGEVPFRGRLEIVMPDSDGVSTRFTWNDLPPVTLAPGESRTVQRIVKLGRSAGAMSIQLHDAERIVARKKISPSDLSPPLPPERDWIVVYGSDMDVAEALGRKSRVGQNTEVTQLTRAEQLPEYWLGWEAVDTILLTTSQLEQMKALTSEQLQAVREWVAMGGRLVWSVGRHGEEILGVNGRFASWAPGEFREIGRLRNLGPLESYAGSAQRMELQHPAQSGIPVTGLTNVQGIVELRDDAVSGTRPLIVRSPMQFGQTVFVAFDLELPEVGQWDGRSRILARVLQPTTNQWERRRGDASTTQVARFGYQDMVGQLRSSLDQFPGVRLVALWWVAALVSLYIVLIGPVDYFLLRDVARRTTLTWVTFPLVTLLFVGLVLGLGPRWKSQEVLVNQVDLVDVDATSARLRATSWAHVYSPRAATYQVESRLAEQLESLVSLQGNVMAWHGLPGTGLGALNTTAAAPPAIDEYRMQTEVNSGSTTSREPAAKREVTLDGLPIAVASTKSLLGRWWGAIELSGNSQLTVDPDGLPRGEIVNPLPVELSDCVVYFGNWAFRLDATRGVLSPGQKTRIEVERALNLQWRLTGRRVIDKKDVGTPWDQHTLEIPRILEMMMFHAAAGGDTYTQLIHRYQPYIDLTEHLALRQAILIGRAPAPAAKLQLNDSEANLAQQWTYFRVIFPVANPRENGS